MERFKGIRLFSYNFSSVGWNLLDGIFMTFYIAFLLPPAEKVQEGMIQFISNETFLGIVTVLGAIMIFGRIIDAVADPLVASWSDRLKLKIGRRRFFLLVGGLPLAVCSVLYYFPPVAGISVWNNLYLAIAFGLYFFFFTVYVGPYLALITELGHSEKERLGMTTAQGYFALIGSAIVMIGGPILLGIFMKSNNPVVSYRMMAILLAILGAVLVYLSVIAVDEKRFSDAKPSTIPLINSFKLTVKNKAFMIYLLANMCLWFLFNIVRSSAIHISLTLLRGDEAFASMMFTLIFVVAAVCFPFTGMLAKRKGKKLTMILALACFAVLAVLLSITGVIPINRKVWGLSVMALMGFPVSVLLIIPNVIVSELCDMDYKQTGERREGMYFGVQGFFMKLNLGLSTAVLALMYSLFGKDIASPLGVRLAPVVGAVIAVLGLIAMSRYPEKEVKKETA